MNRILTLIMVAILAACGAPVEQPAPEETLGALEQPIVALDGHGIAGAVGPSAPRCYLPTWQGGECWLPEHDFWAVSWYSPASGETPGDPTWWEAELKDAIDEVEDWLDVNAPNLQIHEMADNWDSPVFPVLKVRCGEPGGTAAGQISPSVVCPTNCSSGSPGTLKKFDRATIKHRLQGHREQPDVRGKASNSEGQVRQERHAA